MKKILTILICMILLTGCNNKEIELPLPQVSEGMRGQLGIDKNVNEETLDKYLGLLVCK